jgi:hypothetical protein
MERKFPVEPRFAHMLTAWLGHAFVTPGDFPAGRVTSCYFDTDDWECYFESLDGDYLKSKVRLRWYDALPRSGPVNAFLEAKQKTGVATWKRRRPLTVDAEQLRAGRIAEALPHSVLESALAGMGIVDGRRLRPAVTVTYRRSRFVDPSTGFQLAIDSDIEAWPATAPMGDRTAPFPSPVLEIKGRSIELPARYTHIRRWVTVWSSHSKYAMAVESLGQALRPPTL